ncbi:MAG: hypothetical protein ACI8X5_003917, partial [Planctomycetota bacterium]
GSADCSSTTDVQLEGVMDDETVGQVCPDAFRYGFHRHLGPKLLGGTASSWPRRVTSATIL